MISVFTECLGKIVCGQSLTLVNSVFTLKCQQICAFKQLIVKI